MSRADLDKHHEQVQSMFDEVAARYDLTNDVLTAGLDRSWRRAVVKAVDPRPGQWILDLAAGTGTSSEPFAKAGARVAATDLSLGMLGVGRQRLPAQQHPQLFFVAGDGVTLPYPDATFDAVTISFGLRNVEDVPAALAELRRVTKPGGRLVVCEFSTPVRRPLRAAYHQVALRALPAMARAVSSNAPAYGYLVDSIKAWPDQATLATMILTAGWPRVEWRNLTGGIVALHRAYA